MSQPRFSETLPSRQAPRGWRKLAWYLLTLVVLGGAALHYYARPPEADDVQLFTNGTILTMATNALKTQAAEPEAVLVENGKIIAIGTEQALRQQASESPTVIDLQGATLMPGLIEAHTHPMATAMLGTAIDISGFTHPSREAVMVTLKEHAKDLSPTPWIIAFGWDPVMIADLTPPTLAELDAIAPDKPMVVLTQMMHDAYVNSAALAAAGITADTTNPPGAEFVRDSEGNLTGTIHELNAINRLFSAIPPPPSGAINLLLNLQYAEYATAGFTTVGVLGPVGRAKDPVGIMRSLSDNPAPLLRTVVYSLPAQIEQQGIQPETVNPYFSTPGVKFWMDGSPFTGGAAWAEPYEDSWLTRERLHLSEGHTGSLGYTREEFTVLFEQYHRQGFQIAVHVQGERAVDRVVDVAAGVLQRYPRTDHRYRLEPNSLITPEQITRTNSLGITLSFFIDHLYFFGYQLPLLVGEKRLQRYMPLATAMTTIPSITIHGDHPATPIAPFRAMATAVNRETRSGKAIVGNEKISRLQALQAMTINAAWQLGLEEKVGSITPGKQADFVLLSKNPLQTPVQELNNIEVIETWIDGVPVDTRLITTYNLELLSATLRDMLF